MTSPSPTRRRTTRPRSIPDARRAAAWLALQGLIVVSPAVAFAAGWRDLQRTEPPRSAVRASAIAPAGAGDTVAAESAATGPAAGAPDDVQPVAVELPTESAGDAAGEPAAPGGEAAGACVEEGEDCRRALASLRSDSLAGIELDIRVGGLAGRDYPCECRLEGETYRPRRFATTTFTWKAAGNCHKPLYFEHWNLERYGHSHGFVADSFLSAAHFFARIPALPYQLGVELPWECVYPLGYYRPGSCAPWTVPAVPVSGRGLAVGAAAATGIVFILP